MSFYNENLLLYLIAINGVAFVLYGLDKYLAIKGFWRFRDSTLIAITIFGGTLGAVAGQRFFRHKTKKYKLLMPLVLTVHVGIIVAYAFPF